MSSRLVPAEDGWFVWTGGPEMADGVRVRLAELHDGRWHVTGLQIDGVISAETLRAIPIGRIEAVANSGRHGEPVRAPRSAKVPDRIRDNAVGGYPDEFYEVVAGIYASRAGRSKSPVVDLADANNVPVTTAQRWVKEARRRGLLPPGRAGKAG